MRMTPLFWDGVTVSKSGLFAIKVAAFVYQDKGGFFVLFKQKQGIFMKNRASERLRGCSEARFSRFQDKKPGVLLFVLYGD